MRSLFKGCFLFLLISILAGCGGGGTNGNGNTVYIQAALKSGTSVPFVHYSSNGALTGNRLSYVVSSYPYSKADAIKNSNVVINKISYTFTPALGSVAFSPSIPYTTVSGLIAPEGDWTFNDTIMFSADVDAITANGAASGTLQQYDLKVTFTGTEVNTGTILSTSLNSSVYVTIP